MSNSDRPTSPAIRLKSAAAAGVKRLIRIAASTNTVAMSDELIRLLRSSLISVVSSIFVFSS